LKRLHTLSHVFADHFYSTGETTMTNVEIFAIGNELLIGDVLDTNTHWLCRQCTELGGFVQRAVLLRDDIPVIVRELQAAIARAPRLILTTGGLGPTDDDMTLAAVAQALHRPLEQHADALAMVTATFVELAHKGYVDDATMTPARAKMGMLPQGATPLHNSVGAAPGVWLQADNTTIVSLPGVPDELQAIFTESLQPLLGSIFGARVFQSRLMIVTCKDESVLAPLLTNVVSKHPLVYIKSRARRYGADITFRITLSTTGDSKETVAQHLDVAIADLRETLAQAQIAVETITGDE
jgi:molybdenum cofactor synthesis domain-containing protein